MSGFEIKAKGENAEIHIYEDIGEGWLGGISAKSFADEVKKLGKIKNINVKINSYGGSVFDGIAIYNTLRNNSARVRVDIDGIAASIASIIAMAGDEVNIAENGFMMIHDPWVIAAGTAEDLREQANTMDKVRDTLLDTYMKKATSSREAISDMMSEETWLTAGEAHEIGLVDQITGEVQLAASANPKLLAKYKHVPDDIKNIKTPRKDGASIIAARMAKTLRQRKL
jgi:ATP-dependent Clp protease protease subunit